MWYCVTGLSGSWCLKEHQELLSQRLNITFQKIRILTWSQATIPTHFLKIHFNIIIPSTHSSLKWYLSFKFPRYSSLLPISLMPTTCPAHFILLDLIILIQYLWSLPIMLFLWPSIGSKYSPTHPVLKYNKVINQIWSLPGRKFIMCLSRLERPCCLIGV